MMKKIDLRIILTLAAVILPLSVIVRAYAESDSENIIRHFSSANQEASCLKNRSTAVNEAEDKDAIYDLGAESTGQLLVDQGEALLNSEPPEYEKAAELFRRAGLQGDGEGYYRLGQMYEKGLLNVGNPCTDDLSALGKQKAEEYYALAEQNGYDAPSPGWRAISQDEAKEMIALDGGQIIVDVRRQDEYDSGHIPGAVLIPNESISTKQPEELPDLDQIILVYCRSGNRSKQAAQKLADLGYRNVYEFGGIIDWTGEIITTEDETG